MGGGQSGVEAGTVKSYGETAQAHPSGVAHEGGEASGRLAESDGSAGDAGD